MKDKSKKSTYSTTFGVDPIKSAFNAGGKIKNDANKGRNLMIFILNRI